jgi:hypothetical protein
MDFQSTMMDFLSKTLGKTNEELTALLFQKADDGTLTDQISDDALSQLENLHQTHLQSLQDDAGKDQYNEGHQKGKFEALSKEEEWLKKSYNLQGRGKLRDLIAEAIQASASLTEDKVQTHPLFVNAKTAWEEEKSQLIESHTAQLSEATTKVERQMRFSQVSPVIDEALIKAGVSPDFLKPAAKRAFLSQFEGKDFEVTDTGIYIKNPDGKLEKDAHGHPVKLDAFVGRAASEWFPIEKQPTRQAPGNDPADPAKPATKWTKENAPKTQKEFDAIYSTLEGEEAREFTRAFLDANAPEPAT